MPYGRDLFPEDPDAGLKLATMVNSATALMAVVFVPITGILMDKQAGQNWEHVRRKGDEGFSGQVYVQTRALPPF